MPKAAKSGKSKAPAKKKSKKVPQKLSGQQRDAVQDMHDKKLASVGQALKDGKIDHGDAADPDRGILDPEAYDAFQTEHRATGSETLRIKKVICEHLNEHHSRNGKYEWTCGFFLETDPRAHGATGFNALTTEALGPAWSAQLQRELGLTEYEGALCWNGRGMHERHIICVKTKELQKRQIEAAAETAQSMLQQPDQVAGQDVGRIEVKEQVKKLPLVPVRDGGSKEGAPTS